jgi:hypothetical protein
MRDRLIDCAHHHLIFTIPHELHALWRWNRLWFTQQLFASVAATLHELTDEEGYVGAQCGFILALHTWGRSLNFHPHIHCLITDGGLNERDEWQDPKRSCFLPIRVAMALFRGKLLAALRAALEKNALNLPPDLSAQRASNLLNRLGRVKWNVHLRERYAHGQGVMIYLARYLKGGALSNRQLLNIDEHQIGFRYVPHAKGDKKAEMTTLRLRPASFLSRYLQHTPLPGVPVVRHYGLYATRNASQLAHARTLHQQPAEVSVPPRLSSAQYLERLSPEHANALRCPQCHTLLIVRERIARQQGPPVSRH